MLLASKVVVCQGAIEDITVKHTNRRESNGKAMGETLRLDNILAWPILKHFPRVRTDQEQY